jgi:alcohol dehydrogenase
MTKMKAAFISKYGPTEKLILGEVDIPTCRDTDVLVKIHAASLNPIDFKIRDGKIKFLRSYLFPLIMGHDLAGVVSAVGSKVTRFKNGDKVYSRPRNGRTGSLAQFITITVEILDCTFIYLAAFNKAASTHFKLIFSGSFLNSPISF